MQFETCSEKAFLVLIVDTIFELLGLGFFLAFISS